MHPRLYIRAFWSGSSESWVLFPSSCALLVYSPSSMPLLYVFASASSLLRSRPYALPLLLCLLELNDMCVNPKLANTAVY